MYIEPSLQSFIDSKVKFALATFWRDRNEQVLRDTALATCAGFGLATHIVQKGEITWVKTERLKELENSHTAPVDLSTFTTPDEPKITGSLKLILEDFVGTERDQNPEDPETTRKLDLILLLLAGQGLATLIP